MSLVENHPKEEQMEAVVHIVSFQMAGVLFNLLPAISRSTFPVAGVQ
jgi:hypothetical protein